MSELKKAVWDTLSGVDVSKHLKQKGKFDYLQWSVAWAYLCEYYPASTYKFHRPFFFSDGTCEVKVSVTVSEGSNSVKRTMVLPVLNFSNQSSVNPTSSEINKTRMRCLVKAMAMHGLGLSLYANEDTMPEDTGIESDSHKLKQLMMDNAVGDNVESIKAIKDALAVDDYDTAYQAWDEITIDDKQSLWVAPSKVENAPFTTAERAVFKSNSWTEARKKFHGSEDKGEQA